MCPRHIKTHIWHTKGGQRCSAGTFTCSACRADLTAALLIIKGSVSTSALRFQANEFLVGAPAKWGFRHRSICNACSDGSQAVPGSFPQNLLLTLFSFVCAGALCQKGRVRMAPQATRARGARVMSLFVVLCVGLQVAEAFRVPYVGRGRSALTMQRQVRPPSIKIRRILEFFLVAWHQFIHPGLPR